MYIFWDDDLEECLEYYLYTLPREMGIKISIKEQLQNIYAPTLLEGFFFLLSTDEMLPSSSIRNKLLLIKWP